MKDAYEQSFIQGMACAIGVLVRSYDQPSMARDIATMNGYSLSDFENANVDEFDLKEVRKAFGKKEKKSRKAELEKECTGYGWCELHGEHGP
jgi:hypothetical protein